MKLNGEKPKPHDDEVESFEVCLPASDFEADGKLLDIPQVKKALLSGDFKPNCGLILVDFLVRHGIVTPENEADYFEIGWRCHRRLGLTVA